MTPTTSLPNTNQKKPIAQFREEVAQNIEGLREDSDLQALSRVWIREITRHKYAYNFNWMGRPIIQFPQDMMGVQELIWQIQPDLVIETGIAHGGSILYYASLLELLDNPDAYVLGIDIDIRPHNRTEIENHPIYQKGRIQLVEGSAIAPETMAQVKTHAQGKERVLVILDSNHTHEHVLSELELYSPLVSKGSYMVVFDTVIEDMPDDLLHTADRPWGKGNNPKTAVFEFLKTNDRFEVDKDMEAKLLITVAADGWLKCVKD